MYEEMELDSESFFEVPIDKEKSVLRLRRQFMSKYANTTVENVLGGSEIGSLNLVKNVFDNINSSEIHIVIQDSIKKSRKKEKLDYYDKKGSEKKPIYKSNWEYDEKEGDNVLCNPSEYPDPDD
ncbi:5519_t:CDS:2 [Funneliformis caledonium]|uniref:5519_t:CDS:1 n=1 Tax=Funneliformis caledonium TaxID=1117310 RepID=A0A9N9EH66_9GLOM|nr:5519_t:CDS:2 [Funneliformis caledonium]